MAFPDPVVITVNSVAKSLPLIERAGRKAIYENNDKTFQIAISHRPGKARGRERTNSSFRVDQRAIVTSPIDSSNDSDELSMWVVIDKPVYGFSLTQVQQLAAALFARLDATAIAQLFGGES